MVIDDYKWLSKDFVWTFEPRKVASPIIITVPHDCGYTNQELGGILKPRSIGIHGLDSHVWPIAKDIMLKTRVNVVRAMFPRHFIDFNRPKLRELDESVSDSWESAFEDKRLEFIYDHFHSEVRRLIEKSLNCHEVSSCMLIDLHGFSRQPKYGPYDLIFGTGNRTTIKTNHDRELAEFLRDRWYKVFLPREKTMWPGTQDDYDSEYISRIYAREYGIDTIQIEIAPHFRGRECKIPGEKLASDLAYALAWSDPKPVLL